MRLLDLHADVQMHVAQGRISVGHAKAVLAIKDHSTQLLAADQIIRRQLTVRAAERLAQAFANGAAAQDGKSRTPTGSREMDPHVQAVAHKIRERLATHVAIHHTPKKGRIEIEYYGNDDLQRLLELLGVEF